MAFRHAGSVDAQPTLPHDLGFSGIGAGRPVAKKVHSLQQLPKSGGRRTALDVYETLRDSILTGRISPGAFLSQVDVARDLGVSRTPVREALRRLQENGLIAAEPNFRSRVLRLDPGEIESLYVKRILLESFAVGCTANRVSAAQLADARAALQRVVTSASTKSVRSWTSARFFLLEMLAAGAPAPLCKELSLIRQRCRQYEETAGKSQTLLSRRAEARAHQDVVAAIARGEMQTASRVIGQLLALHANEVLQCFSPGFNPMHLEFAAAPGVTPAVGEQTPGGRQPALQLATDTARLAWIDPLEETRLAGGADDSKTSAAPATRGRPTDPNKREAILKAARELFLTYGPSAVTMDRLANTANVAKATVYACYEDKNSVLVAMVKRESELVVPDEWRAQHSHPALQATLIDFGQAFLGFMVNPQLQSLERLVSGIASRDAALGDRLFVAGPGRAMNVLKSILEEARSQGHIHASSIEEAADDLLGLWQGFLRIEVNFRQIPDPRAACLRQRAEHGVQQFLRLYGPANRTL